MDETFAHIWQEFQHSLQRTDDTPCVIAAGFARKVEEIIFAPLAQGTCSREQVAQAKFMLQEQYHQWRRSVPAQHKPLGRHRCLYEIYETSFERLHLMELQLRPVQNIILDYDELTAPPPPSILPFEPAGPEYPDLELGDIEEE